MRSPLKGSLKNKYKIKAFQNSGRLFIQDEVDQPQADMFFQLNRIKIHGREK